MFPQPVPVMGQGLTTPAKISDLERIRQWGLRQSSIVVGSTNVDPMVAKGLVQRRDGTVLLEVDYIAHERPP